MPAIHVPDATYQHLLTRAGRLGTTVEALASLTLEHAALEPPGPDEPPADPTVLTGDAWVRQFDAVNSATRAESTPVPARLPPRRQAARPSTADDGRLTAARTGRTR